MEDNTYFTPGSQQLVKYVGITIGEPGQNCYQEVFHKPCAGGCGRGLEAYKDGHQYLTVTGFDKCQKCREKDENRTTAPIPGNDYTSCPIKKCSLCAEKKPCIKRCSRCYEQLYCSRKCQRLDWKSHKKTCLS